MKTSTMLLLGGAAVVGYYAYKRQKAAAAASTGTATGASTVPTTAMAMAVPMVSAMPSPAAAAPTTVNLVVAPTPPMSVDPNIDDMNYGTAWGWGPSSIMVGSLTGGGRRGGHGHGRGGGHR